MAEKFEFNGKMMTAIEVSKAVPAYGKGAIRKYLRAGAKSVADMAVLYAEGQKRVAKGGDKCRQQARESGHPFYALRFGARSGS